MNKESKTLPHAIKAVVDVYGKNIVGDVRMVNIINDVVSLNDSNAVKIILREILKLDYGKKLLSIDPSKEDYLLKIKSYSINISDSLGYKDVIVQYVLFSIAYGIGLCQNEPYIKRTQQRSTEKASAQIGKESVKPPKETKPVNNFFSNKVLAVFFVVVTIGVSLFYCYFATQSDRELFNENVYSGDSCMSNGDYLNAMESYKKAYQGNYSIGNKDYKEKAFEKIDVLINQSLLEGHTDNERLLNSLQLTKLALLLDLENNDREKLQEYLDGIEKQIAEKIENGHNILITNIAANNGKLDESGKSLLLELIELSPDDHWLNIIKENSYE